MESCGEKMYVCALDLSRTGQNQFFSANQYGQMESDLIVYFYTYENGTRNRYRNIVKKQCNFTFDSGKQASDSNAFGLHVENDL